METTTRRDAGHLPRVVYGGYVALVLVLLLTPITQEIPVPELTLFDKMVHFGLFAGLAIVGLWNLWSLATAVGAAVVVAGATELLQAPLTYRSADVWDFVAGALGSVLAAAVATRVWRLARRRGSP